ncbi:MAG: class I SAM-dependent methyltransferase [Clostridia bacterium]|nr:class I SAM-dependent methyltransferase [Clostridia bacterium]
MPKTDVIDHYERLILEGNDPVKDPEPLRAHMDKWDGKPFIDALELTKDKIVLEIGVGTGRLAVRTAPLCRIFHGIDLSSRTILRAMVNLMDDPEVKFKLFVGDFLEHEFEQKYDVIYSSLTFMHIEDKQRAIDKVAALLNKNGRFVLSIDKNPSEILDFGTRKIKIYPDTPEHIRSCIERAGLTFLKQLETEFAYLILAQTS